MKEPLTYFFENYSFEFKNIKKFFFGKIYTAVMLRNGSIGVCANLGEILNSEIIDFNNINFDNIKHRIILNAYYNAMFNNDNINYSCGDIMPFIDIEKYKNIVMIGYFRPVVEKFYSINKNISIFDLNDKTICKPMSEQKDYLSRCDLAIVTATTITNNTFFEIEKNCAGDIYLLGPTSILHNYFFEFKNIKAIFGSIFTGQENTVLNLISNNFGTRDFLKFGKKVYLQNIKF